jgi:hypothetical protein
MLTVQQHHLQRLVGQRGDARRQQASSIFGAANLRPVVDGLELQPACQLQRGLDLRGLGRADPVVTADLVNACFGQCPQAAEAGISFCANSTALPCEEPVRRVMASNSASLSAAVPSRSKRSRGRWPTAMSRIRTL